MIPTLLQPGSTYEPSFDEESHTYTTKGGVILPSVTQILHPLSCEIYASVDKEYLRQRANFGSAVHMCTELDDTDDLDIDSVDAEWLPRLEAWRDFKRSFEVEMLLIEKKLACSTFAGTIDRVAVIDGEKWVIDIKTTSTIHPMAGIQLAAYEALAYDFLNEKKHMKRAVVQLKEDGYVFKKFTNDMDYLAFASLLNIQNWKTLNA